MANKQGGLGALLNTFARIGIQVTVGTQPEKGDKNENEIDVIRDGARPVGDNGY
jgi:hypothetical protein